jgi:hypothetical protein
LFISFLALTLFLAFKNSSRGGRKANAIRQAQSVFGQRWHWLEVAKRVTTCRCLIGKWQPLRRRIYHISPAEPRFVLPFVCEFLRRESSLRPDHHVWRDTQVANGIERAWRWGWVASSPASARDTARASAPRPVGVEENRNGACFRRYRRGKGPAARESLPKKSGKIPRLGLACTIAHGKLACSNVLIARNERSRACCSFQSFLSFRDNMKVPSSHDKVAGTAVYFAVTDRCDLPRVEMKEGAPRLACADVRIQVLRHDALNGKTELRA